MNFFFLCISKNIKCIFWTGLGLGVDACAQGEERESGSYVECVSFKKFVLYRSYKNTPVKHYKKGSLCVRLSNSGSPFDRLLVYERSLWTIVC